MPRSAQRPTAGGPDLTGVRAIITGSTSGLGLAMAEALVAAGARVAVSGRDSQRVAAARALLGDHGSVGVVLDVRDDASVSSGLEAAAASLGGLDVVVNNAGLGMRSVNPEFLQRPTGFWEVSPAGFRAVIETNLTGYFLVARRAIPYLRQSGRGRIINVTMNHATMRRRGFVPYGPSRAGAEALSHIMAADLAPLGIAVNLLLPGGATLTGMIPDGVDQATRSRLLPASVMGAPLCWLCSPAAEGVSDARIVATEFERWLGEREGAR